MSADATRLPVGHQPCGPLIGRKVGARSRPSATLVAVLTLITLGTAGCGRNPQVLPDDAFRNVVPANAQLSDEIVDDGSSMIEGGERSVLRVAP